MAGAHAICHPIFCKLVAKQTVKTTQKESMVPVSVAHLICFVKSAHRIAVFPSVIR
jgi:hypothetical protein